MSGDVGAKAKASRKSGIAEAISPSLAKSIAWLSIPAASFKGVVTVVSKSRAGAKNRKNMLGEKDAMLGRTRCATILKIGDQGGDSDSANFLFFYIVMKKHYKKAVVLT